MNRFSLLVLAICGLSTSILAATPKVIGRGSIKNFQTQAENARIFATNAVQLPNGLFELTLPRVERYKASNVLEMILEAPVCLLDRDNGKAFSATNLTIRSADGKFAIRGIGFLFESKLSHLTISNNVESEIKRAALKIGELKGPVDPINTNSTLKIRSERFDYSTERALFERNVEVQDADGIMTTERLFIGLSKAGQVSNINAKGEVKIDYQGMKASGDEASYDVAKDTLTLTHKALWSLNDRHGASDTLLLKRSGNELHADGNVRLRLPYRGLTPTNSPTLGAAATNVLEIASQQFDYSTNQALFTGQVVAREPRGELRANNLRVEFNTNETQVTRAFAQGSVELLREDRKASAEKALYDFARDIVRLEGGADGRTSWSMGPRKGQSESLEFAGTGQEFAARGRVEMDLPVNAAMLPATLLTNAAALTNLGSGPRLLHILAGEFTRKGDESLFRDKVQARLPEGQIDAQSVLLRTGASNQVTHVIAENAIVIRQKDRTATGEKAIYDAATGLVELTGNPRIIDSRGRVRAGSFILDLPHGTFRTKGPYKIEFRRDEKPGASGL